MLYEISYNRKSFLWEVEHEKENLSFKTIIFTTCRPFGGSPFYPIRAVYGDMLGINVQYENRQESTSAVPT